MAFADYQVRHSPHARATIRRIRTGYFFGFLLLALALWTTQGRGILFALLALVALLLFFFSPRIYRLRLRRHLSHGYHDPDNRFKCSKRKLRIRDEALEHAADASHSTVQWSAVVKVDQTPSHGFLCLGSDSANIIPREAIGDDAFQAFMPRARSLWRDAAG